MGFFPNLYAHVLSSQAVNAGGSMLRTAPPWRNPPRLTTRPTGDVLRGRLGKEDARHIKTKIIVGRKMTMKQRFFAWLVVLATALSLLQAGALAAGEEAGGDTPEVTVPENETGTGETPQEDSNDTESSESNSEPAGELKQDEDGYYLVSADTDFETMVQMINSASSGANLAFRFQSRRTNNGTVYQFTSSTEITVPEGVTVTVDLYLCDMLFA